MPVDKFLGDSAGCGAAQTASWGSPVGLVHRAGDTMLGDLSMGGFHLKDVGNPLDSSDAATKEYVDTRDVLPASGGTMSGALHMGGNAIVGLANPKTDQSAATKNYVDALVRSTTGLLDSKVLQLDGSKAPTHDIGWGKHRISELADPKAPQDAATKAYVDKKYMRRFDRYLLSVEWVSRHDRANMPASLEPVTGQNYSTLERKSGDLIVKKPGFYTVILVGTRTTNYDAQPFTIEYHIDSPPGVLQNNTKSRVFNFRDIIEISRENTAVRLIAATDADLLFSVIPFPQLNIRATLLIEKLL